MMVVTVILEKLEQVSFILKVLEQLQSETQMELLLMLNLVMVRVVSNYITKEF